jgi:hypothetical protein
MIGVEQATSVAARCNIAQRLFTCSALACGQKQRRDITQYRFCAERVGVWLADDGARSGPETRRLRFAHYTARTGLTAAARQIVSKLDSYAFGNGNGNGNGETS